ncbi:MAG: DUF6576 domain-containing protein, partial [Planctomycetota bacterium]
LFQERLLNRYKLRKEIAGMFYEARREEELDNVLKKVATSGIDSLTRVEQKFLRSVSKEYKKKKQEN